MKTHESSLFKKIFSQKNHELQAYMDTHGDTIGCVFSSDGKNYEITTADEHASEKTFKDLARTIDDKISSALETARSQSQNHTKKSISESIYALFKKTRKNTL